MKIKIAVIIKHPYRDFDWRVDIYDCDENITDDQIKEKVMRNMLGPFQVVSISRRVSMSGEFQPLNPQPNKEV